MQPHRKQGRAFRSCQGRRHEHRLEDDPVALYNQFANSDQGQSDMDPTQQQGLRVSPKQIRQTALTYQIRVVFLEALAKQRGINVADTENNADVASEIAQAPSTSRGGQPGTFGG